MRERNVGAAQIITFRIGINVGDIIVYGDDIFGNGVACEIKAGDVVVIPAPATGSPGSTTTSTTSWCGSTPTK